MANPVETAIAADHGRSVELAATELLGGLVQPSQYVGELYSIGYETALVQVHDYYRKQVGGIPGLSFLVATRIVPGASIDYRAEDACVVLLRVLDSAPLPAEEEAIRVRVESGQRVSGETGTHWDSEAIMDPSTAHALSFAGVKCRVIGTFYLAPAVGAQAEEDLVLRFGSDISNYYPNRGMKVYRPNGAALGVIANYRDPDRDDLPSDQAVVVGSIRYASTSRPFQGVDDVEVSIMPADLLGAKTALFGMTRTGKSNSTKIILQSVFRLRNNQERPIRVGQLVFDPNGEYANENVQDNHGAIRNLWTETRNRDQTEVVTYGMTPHPNDTTRNLMLLNFYADRDLDTGKQIIDAALVADSAKYIQNFRQVRLSAPAEADRSATTRHRRRALAYRALLSRAGLEVPAGLRPDTHGLFRQELLDAMRAAGGGNSAHYRFCADTLGAAHPTWSAVATAMEYLREFIGDANSGYQAFDQWYVARPGGSGEAWADGDLNKILEMFYYPNGPRQIGIVAPQHSASVTADYAAAIYQHLCQGRLVIVDQSSGDIDLNRSSAERIMWQVFLRNQQCFREGHAPPDVLVYVEEAHNLLPSGSEDETGSVWVRTAKEGAKYRIGMVYATQEVSSVQRNILKNTANWFIGHLNNTDEIRDLSKFYDFADFQNSILRAQDKGFLRMKTLSNLFVVPVQVRRFEVRDAV